MIQPVLKSKNLVACLLAAATGMVLYIKMPLPEGNLFFELTFLWARPVFVGFKYSYVVFLHTTPYIGYANRVIKARPELQRGAGTVGPTDSQRIQDHQLTEDQRDVP